jgi:DNA repair protein RecO (recombination protein O)
VPLYSSEALVLRTYQLREFDRIVVFLTKDRGKRRGVARGARRARSPFAGGLEPLTKASVAYFEKERGELVSLNYVEPLTSPMSAVSPDALGHVGYFAELIDEWAPEADPNETLYRLGASVVDSLASGVPIEPLARYFEYWLLRLQGVYPPHAACHRCGSALDDGGRGGAWLEPGEHVFTCGRCTRLPAGVDRARGAMLSPGALAFLRGASKVSPRDIGAVPMAPRAGRELEAIHRTLIATHLEKELRSVRVLRELGQ